MHGGKRNNAGRPSGSQNQISIELREWYLSFLSDNKEKVQELFDKVSESNPSKALELFCRFSAFVLPKIQAIDMDDLNEGQKAITIEIIDSREQVEDLDKTTTDLEGGV